MLLLLVINYNTFLFSDAVIEIYVLHSNVMNTFPSTLHENLRLLCVADFQSSKI